jgi:hypothetical protein
VPTDPSWQPASGYTPSLKNKLILTHSTCKFNVQNLEQRATLKLHRYTIFTFFILLNIRLVSQVTMSGGKGTLRLYEAETITAGDFYVNSVGTFFVTKIPNTAILAKDYTINLGLTLGISRRFEVFTHLVPYQSDQVHLIGPPGDSKIGLKMVVPTRGFPQFGIATFVDFPTARIHPLAYEPYSDDAVGYAFLGLFTLNFRHAASPLPLKITLNAGLKSKAGNKLFTSETDQLIGGIGMKLAIRSVQIYTEITGEIFFNNPAIDLAQNSLRWSAGYKFLVGGIIFDVGSDIEIGGYKPTQSERHQIPRFLEDYADWKIIVAMTYRWTLFKNWDKATKEEQRRQKIKEQESDEVRKQREKVLEELQQYEKRLRDEKKKDVPF